MLSLVGNTRLSYSHFWHKASRVSQKDLLVCLRVGHPVLRLYHTRPWRLSVRFARPYFDNRFVTRYETLRTESVIYLDSGYMTAHPLPTVPLGWSSFRGISLYDVESNIVKNKTLMKISVFIWIFCLIPVVVQVSMTSGLFRLYSRRFFF